MGSKGVWFQPWGWVKTFPSGSQGGEQCRWRLCVPVKPVQLVDWSLTQFTWGSSSSGTGRDSFPWPEDTGVPCWIPPKLCSSQSPCGWAQWGLSVSCARAGGESCMFYLKTHLSLSVARWFAASSLTGPSQSTEIAELEFVECGGVDGWILVQHSEIPGWKANSVHGDISHCLHHLLYCRGTFSLHCFAVLCICFALL